MRESDSMMKTDGMHRMGSDFIQEEGLGAGRRSWKGVGKIKK